VKTRILFLIPSFRTGGAEVQLLSLVKGLDKKLFEITVAAFYKGNALDNQFKELSNVRIVYLEKGGSFDFKFLDRLKKLLSGGFDIIQPYNISARYYGIKLGRKYKIPVIIATERSAKLLPTSIGSRIFLLLEKFEMRKATVVVANSEAGREFSIKRGIKRSITRVIYNGIDGARLFSFTSRTDFCSEYALSQKAKIVGTVGRLESQKDPKTLLRAARIVINKDENVFFLFVGDGPLFNELQEFAKEIRVFNNCLFVGNQKNVAGFLNSMDVFTLTSKEIEGCSNAILEAMMMGKPVIATDVGGNREIVGPGNTGEIVPADDPDLLAEHIIMLLDDESKKLRYGKNAKNIAEQKYSLNSMVKNYQQLYAELLK
jgi:glycosyltransferase involved in cell wall biosynthesis